MKVIAETIKGINVVIGAETTGLSKALSDVNKKSRDIQSELREVEKLLKLDPGNTELIAQKQKLLSDAVSNTAEKLDRLKSAQQQVNEQFAKGEISEGQYRAFQREIAKTEQELSGFENKLKSAQPELKKLGNEAENTASKLKKAGDGIKNAGSNMTMGITAPLVGIAALATEGTKELREDMAKLETNALAAGAGLDTTKNALRDLNAITGETDSNIEALSNLMQAGFKDTQMEQVLESLSGAVIKFPDTLKIEGLADGLQETLATGKAIGPFAEMLERMGLNLDDFNSGLAEANKNGTTQQYVLDTLAKTGLSEVNKLYRENNKELVDNANAQFDMQQAFAELGKLIQPIVTGITQKIAELLSWFNGLNDGAKKTILVMSGIAAATGPVLVGIGQITKITGSLVAAFGKTAVAGVAAGTGTAAAGTAAGAASVGFWSLLGPIALIVAGLAALVAGGVLLYKHLKKEAIPEIERFGDEVSESTQQAAGAFMDLNDEATVSLKKLAWSGETVTKEMSESITGTFEKMGQQILGSIDERHAEEIASMQEFFASAKGMTEQEQAEILAKVKQSQEDQKTSIAEAQARVKEIMETASTEKRALTSAEAAEINRIQQEMLNTGIDILSENELEQKAIMERMKANAETLSARQAAEVAASAIKQRDDVVRTAEEQYNDVVKQIIKQRDEAGTITAEQADAMIKEAQRQRDEVVSKAEDMHLKTIEQAKLQAGEHVNQVDWTTGEILKKWEVYWNKLQGWQDKVDNAVKNGWNKLKEGVVKTAVAMWEDIKKQWNDMLTFFEELPEKMKQLGVDIIQGMINGISSMKDAVVKAAKDVAAGVGDSVKDFFKIKSPSRLMMGYGINVVQGLANGISDTARQAVRSASAVSSAVAGAMAIDANGMSATLSSFNGSGGAVGATTTNSTNVSFADMFRGANFVVRDDSDINKIAQQLGGVVTQNLRALGGA